MKSKRQNDLGNDPIGSLLIRLAIPAITAQLVNALYNIVDRMYIGHIEGTGDLALTGLGVAFPVIMFISALSALAGMGGGSKAAIRMGAGDQEGANAILGGCTALLVVISLVVTVLFQVFKDPMLLLFGASENTLGYASDYLGIYLWGTIAVQFSLGLNNFITTQGFSTVSMLTVIIGAVCNIVLDPVLIFGFDMGVQGAALASSPRPCPPCGSSGFSLGSGPDSPSRPGTCAWTPRCSFPSWPSACPPSSCSPPKAW